MKLDISYRSLFYMMDELGLAKKRNCDNRGRSRWIYPRAVITVGQASH